MIHVALGLLFNYNDGSHTCALTALCDSLSPSISNMSKKVELTLAQFRQFRRFTNPATSPTPNLSNSAQCKSDLGQLGQLIKLTVQVRLNCNPSMTCIGYYFLRIIQIPLHRTI